MSSLHVLIWTKLTEGVYAHVCVRCASHLVAQHIRHVAVVPELRGLPHEQGIPCKDGGGPQDEGGKEVGVNVVPSTPQLPGTKQTLEYAW